ncbi:MAG: carboxypeptidase regulatory-like domain-containing protein [Chloroflexi bacterium]|nr:carboxypeptidase regulatory-like domain-containing protein [Chloroflexota bacterium]
MPDEREIPWRLLEAVAEARADALEMEVFEQALRADGLEEPPTWVLQRAIRIARKIREFPRPGLPGRVRRVVAQLLYDSQLQPAPTGVRGSERGARRLLYQGDAVGVDLEIRQHVALVGQILPEVAPEGLAGAEVQLHQRDRRIVASTQADADGQFSFEGVRPGDYDLTIRLSDTEIAISGIEI